MYRPFIQALCAIALAFPQSMPELLDRLVTITSLSEFRDREFDQTVTEIRELLPLAPMREQSYEQIKNILLGVGLKAEAEIVLRAGLERFSKSRLLRVYLAEALSEMGRSPEALGALLEASRLPRPEGLDAATDKLQRAFILLRIGSIQLATSRLDEALTAYRQAVEIVPEWSAGRIELGKAYFAANRLEEARAEFERAVRQTPANKEAHLSLAETHLALGQWQQAAAAAERAAERGASGSRTLYLRGTALIRIGRHEEGQALLQEFARVEADSQELQRHYREIDAISLAAIRALQEGNGNAAIQQLIQGIASYPDSSRLHMNLAMILSRVGQHQTAVETLESMLKRTNDRRFLIHRSLAEEYRILGDMEASRHHRQVYLSTMEKEFLGAAAR
jgi:tetratricopeptide (TPR) repeat protein